MTAPAPAPPASQPSGAAAGAGTAQRCTDEPRYTISVSCRLDNENAQVSFTTFRRTLIQQIMDSASAFFKISPSQSQTAQLVLGGKQVISFTAQSTVEDLKLTTPDRQSLELVLMDEEPEVTFPVRDQYGNEEVLRARLYHPFLDAVRRLLDPDSPALQTPTPAPAQPPPPAAATTSTNQQNQQNSSQSQNQQQNQQNQHGLDVDLYRASDVSLISLQNSPAACGLQGGEPLLLYRYGRCSREYWQTMGQPERGLKPTFAGLYISDYKNQFQGRAVFRHDLAMPLEYLLTTYCKWRGIDMDTGCSFLWLQFYMRLSIKDTGLGRGMDDGDTIYIYDKQDLQGMLWDGVLDGNADQVEHALDAGASLDGPEASFESITSRWPLHAAAANNHLQVARLLVQWGADVDRLDAVSEPALWHAVEQGHGEMVSLLVELGATASDLPAPAGKTKADYAALCHAAEKGSLAMVQLLLDKGANPYTYDDTGYCAYDYLVDQAKPLELLRALLKADTTFAATQRAYQQAYQRLCAAVKRAQRYPALGCNCRTCNSVVEVRAAEAEATQTLKAQIGCVALVRAVQAGGPHCLDAMKLLYEHGALLDGQDADGRTALHQAIRYNRLAEAKWLVMAGAHLDVPDFEGLLPLHQAACTGNVEFAKLLVEAGAPINLHTVKYITQESLEAQTKKQETGPGGRKAAKKRNALDVTGLTTIGGNSALALAVRHGHTSVVEFLLSHQASFDLKNPADSSAFHAALDRGAASVASKLLQHLNKPKPGKAGVAVSSTSTSTSTATTKVKSKSGDVSSAKDKPSKKLTAPALDPSTTSSKAGNAGSAPSPTPASDSDGGADSKAGARTGDASSPEPALAVDAGAGLREIVQAERERLRQEKGLGRSSVATEGSGATGGAAAAVKPAQSLMAQLEALKAAEKAASAAKAAAEEKAALEAAARAKAEAEAEAARAKADAEAKAKAEVEAAARAEAEAKAKAEAAVRAKAEAKAREEQERKAAAEAAARAKAQEQEAAKAKQAEEEARAKAQQQQQESKAAGGDATCQQQAAGDEGGDGAAAAAKPAGGVQILFRSTALTATTVKSAAGATTPANGPAGATAVVAPAAASNGPKTGPGAASKVAGAVAAAPDVSKSAAAAAAAALTSAVGVSSKKGRKGKTLSDEAPGTPSKHAPAPVAAAAVATPAAATQEPVGSASKAANKRAARAAAPASAATAAPAAATIAPPTAASLAASAALSQPLNHLTRPHGAHGNGPASVSSTHDSQHLHGMLHDNGGPHSVGSYDTHDDSLIDEQGPPGQSPRHAHQAGSTLSTPVRSQRPPSRHNSFSNASSALPGWSAASSSVLSPMQQGASMPAASQGLQGATGNSLMHADAVLFPGAHSRSGASNPVGSSLHASSKLMGVQGIGFDVARGSGSAHASQHHGLGGLQHHSPAPGRHAAGMAGGSPGTEDGYLDDFQYSHLESVAASVLPDESPTKPLHKSHHAGGPRASTPSLDAQSGGNAQGSGSHHTSSSPFGLGGPSAAVQQAWEQAGTGNTPRSLGQTGGLIAQRAVTAPLPADLHHNDLLAGLQQPILSAGDGLGSDTTSLSGLAGKPRLPGVPNWEQSSSMSTWLNSASGNNQGANAGQGSKGMASAASAWSSWLGSGSNGNGLGSGHVHKADSSNDLVNNPFSIGTSIQSVSTSSNTGGGGGGASGLAAAAAAPPFIPGETSHWRAGSLEGASARGFLAHSSTGAGSSGATSVRELDPLPHLPASLFEDDLDLVTDATSSSGPTNSNNQGAGHQAGNGGGGGSSLGSSGAAGGGGGAQGGRSTPGAGSSSGAGGASGGMQSNRPPSRGRPGAGQGPAGMRNAGGGGGASNDGSAASNQQGRYGAVTARLPAGLPPYPGMSSAAGQGIAPSAQGNPALGNSSAYGASGGPAGHAASQESWYGVSHGLWPPASQAAAAAAAYVGLTGMPSPQHQLPGMQGASGHSSLYTSMLHAAAGMSGGQMGGGGHAAAWADAQNQGGGASGYGGHHWHGQGRHNMNDVLISGTGAGQRGGSRGLTPASQANPNHPRYRPH